MNAAKWGLALCIGIGLGLAADIYLPGNTAVTRPTSATQNTSGTVPEKALSAALLADLGRACEKHEQHDLAVNYLRRAIESDTAAESKANSQLDLGLILLKQGDVDEARALIQSAVDTVSASGGGYQCLRAGRGFAAAGLHKDSVAMFRKAYGSVSEQMKGSVFAEWVTAAASAGTLDELEADLQAELAAAKGSDILRAKQKLGLLLWNGRKDPQRSKPVFEELYNLTGNPKEKAACGLVLADILVAGKEFSAAADRLKELVPLTEDPQQADMLRSRLGQLYARGGDQTKAVSEFAEMMATAKDDQARRFAQQNYLRALDKSGGLDEFLKKTEAEIKTDPSNRASWELLGIAYGEIRKDPAKAKQAYLHLTELDPENKLHIHRLAEVQEEMGETEAAAALIEQLAKKAESPAYYYERLALLYQRTGDKQRSILWGTRLTDEAPQDAMAHARLARIYETNQRTDLAATEYRQASTLSKTADDKERYLLRAANAYTVGNANGDAEKALREVIASSQSKPVLDQAKRMLVQLYEKQGKIGQLKLE